MARIIGGVGTTHVPSIGGAIAKGLQQDPYWKPFFDGFGVAHRWLAEERPDVAVVFENREGILAKKTSGYYHEYTVPTPGADTRATRRIITGAHGDSAEAANLAASGEGPGM